MRCITIIMWLLAIAAALEAPPLIPQDAAAAAPACAAEQAALDARIAALEARVEALAANKADKPVESWPRHSLGSSELRLMSTMTPEEITAAERAHQRWLIPS